MSMEKQCRRKPDIEGIAVRLRNGEDWLIPVASIEPVFEKEDGQWMFKYLGVGEPYKKHFQKILDIKKDLADYATQKTDNESKEDVPDADSDVFTKWMDELTKETLEMTAMALDANYELTAQHLGVIIDPQDQVMLASVLAALRGIDLNADKDDDTAPEEEKKKQLNGSMSP